MLIYHCYVCRAPQCCTLWGQVIEGGAGGGGDTHTKQVSVFMGTNEFYKVMQTRRCAHYTRDTRKRVKKASTRIPSERRQGLRQTPTLALGIHNKSGH